MGEKNSSFNMKNQPKSGFRHLRFTGIFTVILCCVLSFIFHFRYISGTRYSEEIRLQASTKPTELAVSVTFKGITPGGKKLSLNNDSSSFLWTLYYGFFSHILVEVPAFDTSHVKGICFVHGDQYRFIEFRELIPCTGNFCTDNIPQTAEFLIPENIVQRTGYFKLYRAAFLRIPWLRLLTLLLAGGIFLWIYPGTAYKIFRFILQLLSMSLRIVPSGIRMLFSIHHTLRNRATKHFHAKQRLYKKTARLILTLIVSVLIAFFLFYLWILIRYGAANTSSFFVISAGFWLLIFVIFRLVFRKRKKGIRKFAFLWIILWLLLCTAEIWLRNLGTYKTYNETRGFFYVSGFVENHLNIEPPGFRIHRKRTIVVDNLPEYTYEKTTNKEGICDAEHPLKKKPGEFRIMGIGNSFTEGQGAPKDSTWLQQLRYGIDSMDKVMSFRVISGGVAGNDVFFTYMLFRERLILYSPDIVIFPIGPSDIDFIRYRGGMERFRPDGSVQYRKGPWWEWLYASSHLFRLLMEGIFQYDYMFLTPEMRKRETADALDKIYTLLQEMQQMSDEKGFRLMVVFFPDPKTFKKERFVFSPLVEKLKSEKKITVLDLYPYYQNNEGVCYNNYSRYYWPYDAHHRSRGYQVFARGILEELIRTHYLDPLIYGADSSMQKK